MGLRSWVKGLFTGRRVAQGRPVRASYDAAQAGADAEHWSWADALNANASNSPDVRKVLRERARYECDNNGYLGGLVDKLGNDLIGRGPRVQLTIPGVSREVTREIERRFQLWGRAVGLAAKLRLLDNMAVRDGEGFALLTRNPALDPAGVQLDLKLYETDQVETPFLAYADRNTFYGGKLDDFGNVTEWHFLKVHPGSDVWPANPLDHDAIPADSVIHWFKPRRAGQTRGVPEVLSSLSLFGYLRRYTLATVAAAETAAMLAGVLKSSLPAGRPDGGPQVATMEDVPLVRGALLTLPEGWDATQFRPEQPITAYKDFKHEILSESGAPVGAPRNIATGSSAEYNYSSGRLDHGIYQRGVGVRRGDFCDRVLDKVFREWLDEAALVPGLIPDGLPLRAEWSWVWFFDGFASLDPQKDATANKTMLESGQTTLSRIAAERGEDWEELIEQQEREAAFRARLRRPAADPAPDATAPARTGPGGESSKPAAGAETQKAAAKSGAVQDAALNGAQIASLLQIVDRVTEGTVSPKAAAAIIQVAFPLMKPAAIALIVNALEVTPSAEGEAANAA